MAEWPQPGRKAMVGLKRSTHYRSSTRCEQSAVGRCMRGELKDPFQGTLLKYRIDYFGDAFTGGGVVLYRCQYFPSRRGRHTIHRENNETSSRGLYAVYHCLHICFRGCTALSGWTSPASLQGNVSCRRWRAILRVRSSQ